ncbi:hypothetical protein Z043_117462 [Scleropages formosus]|uniref:Uncharacterized protein n=1 Tax=Scleropages formosus TaxID=113540 RepID=A0A0P7WKD8_SCLFO|nr:hypothetical protein Z043_117462 [Scleropages formosus]
MTYLSSPVEPLNTSHTSTLFSEAEKDHENGPKVSLALLVVNSMKSAALLFFSSEKEHTTTPPSVPERMTSWTDGSTPVPSGEQTTNQTNSSLFNF